jgi:PAS domain S-box-containing protein
MAKGGLNISNESDVAVRYVVLFSTIIFIFYDLLVLGGVVQSPNFISVEVSALVLIAWLLLGAYHFFKPAKTRRSVAYRFILYEALTLISIVFVTGFMQPFALVVVLLLLAANLYFGPRGLSYSAVAVILVAMLDVIFRYEKQPYILTENIIGVAAIMVISVSIITVMASQEMRQKKALHARHVEQLQYDRILTIINNLSDATFSTDSQGNVLMYNAACLNLLDTNESLKNKNIGSLFKLTDELERPVNLSQLLSKSKRTTTREDLSHTFSDGEEIHVELTFAPIKSSFGETDTSTQNGYIVIARDVTKAKSLEEERDEFISVVSHELRTPITIVEGTLSNLQVLTNRPTPPTPELLKSTLDTAHDQIMYLAKMVNDLSTLSRAERGVADAVEPIVVDDLMHHLHTQYQKDAADKGLLLDIDLGTKLGTIKVSRLYVEELLQNFITNAIKYTKEGTVTMTAKQSKGRVTFSVKDSGIGISRTDQEKIFEKFYRSEDYRIRETGGTGLGLYVSTKLASKLGTQITLTSRLNHGSTFSFELPTEV